ncbi:MAG: hypothetical protein HW388_740 [Dehalococcoidia bacterium]|nr:hypothetical protein [Dehalococcoidia bacterium]
MSEPSKSFVEVCVYEVKPNRVEEFEGLIGRVSTHHRDFPGVKDVRYMKRTHRQRDFAAVKMGEPPIKLTRAPKSVTYVLYWELESEIAHGQATKAGLEHFFKQFARCLVTTPRIILGERIQ